MLSRPYGPSASVSCGTPSPKRDSDEFATKNGSEQESVSTRVFTGFLLAGFVGGRWWVEPSPVFSRLRSCSSSPPWPPTRSRLRTASSKLNGRPPRRLGLVPEPPLALRGLLDPTTPSAPRPSEFRPEDSISLITSAAYARLDCYRAFPSQPRCRPKASPRQRRLSTSSPNRHLDEREDGQPNPEILWNP